MKHLERLTAAILRKAEASGKAAGWYELCRRGYLPAEITLYAEPTILNSDVVHRVREHAEANDLPIPVSCVRREKGRSAPPEDWRAAFRATVMRTGLVLSLTQAMLEYLCATADGVRWDRALQMGSSLAKPCNAMATAGSLEKRGLIKRRNLGGDSLDSNESYHELTEAGEAVVLLLKSVGVFVEADIAIERRAAKSS